MRKLLTALAFLLPVLALAAGTAWHQPTGSGTQKLNDVDPSEVIWLEEFQVWVVVDNSGTGGVRVHDIDGDELKGFSAIDCDCCSSGQNNTEDLALVAQTGSDYLYIIDEGGTDACVCRLDFRAWRTASYSGSPSISKEWCVDDDDSAGATDNGTSRGTVEGMAFVPGGCNPANCEGGGIWYFASQDTSGIVEAFELSVSAQTGGVYDAIRKGEWAHPCPNGSGTPWVNGDGASLEYDWGQGYLYYTDDNSADGSGGNAVCVFTTRRCSGGTQNCAVDADCPGVETCTAWSRVGSWDIGTNSANEVEGVGMCPSCGYFAFAVDTTGGEFNNGLYIFADSFCGDGIISAVETCDGGSFGASTCSTVLGSGNVGHLTCDATCATVTSPACRTTNPEWYDVAWKERRKLTIQEAQIPGTTDFTDFPLLVSFTADAGLINAVQADGDDVLFTASDGITKLDHDLDEVDAATGKVIAWVRIPTLESSASNTDIYMYYGNGAASAQQNEDATWASAFIGVYHLSGADTTPDDASGNANAMSETGDPTEAATGTIGQGVSVARGSSILTAPTLASFNFDTTDLSICAWFNMSSFSPAAADWHVFAHGSGTGDTNGRYYWRAEASGANATCATGGGTCASAADCTGGNAPPCNAPRLASRLGTTNPTDDTTATSSGVWYRACMVHNSDGGAGGTDSYSAFRNGTVFTNVNNLTVTGVFTSHATADWTFGGAVHATDGFGEGMTGTLDEIWIRTTNVSADQIAAEYNNQSAPGTFVVTGANEVRPRRVTN